METKLVVIGNSQGVRLPKAVVEEAGIALEQALAIDVRDGAIVLTPVGAVRQGWEQAAREAAAGGEDLWGSLPPATRVDEDWRW